MADQAPLELTAAGLKDALFRGPVAFYDGRNGMARQDFQCVAEPRFGYFWARKDRKDKGRQAYMVDGREVADLDEAARLLALPPAPDSPDELRRKSHDEFKASPRLSGATRANSEARANADAGPMGPMRSWLHRASSPWHNGINALADQASEAGEEWPRWLYDTKSAAHESYRAIYLFAADREADTGLKCAMGKKCRNCPILQTVERTMIAARGREKFPADIDEADIDAAKAWTCIGHILTSGTHPTDGAFFWRKGDDL